MLVHSVYLSHTRNEGTLVRRDIGWVSTIVALNCIYCVIHSSMQCCVGVLCVRGCVYPALLDYCLAAKVVVVSALNRRQLEALCHISNTTALSSILHCTDVRTLHSLLLHINVQS